MKIDRSSGKRVVKLEHKDQVALGKARDICAELADLAGCQDSAAAVKTLAVVMAKFPAPKKATAAAGAASAGGAEEGGESTEG